jgi:hypothetical protein
LQLEKQHVLEGCSKADFQAGGTNQYPNTWARNLLAVGPQPIEYKLVITTPIQN